MIPVKIVPVAFQSLPALAKINMDARILKNDLSSGISYDCCVRGKQAELQREFHDNAFRISAATDKTGAIKGYSVTQKISGDEWHLSDLYTVARKGDQVGKQLVLDVYRKAMAGHVEKISVIPTPDSYDFYDKMGFHPLGPDRSIWEIRKDAIPGAAKKLKGSLER